VRDYADVKGDGRITRQTAHDALAMLDVDPQGFDLMDRKLLEAVIHRFDGGPVGLDNIAASIGEEPGTIEDVIEPYLIQQGYLQRTPRGRVATLAPTATWAWRRRRPGAGCFEFLCRCRGALPDQAMAAKKRHAGIIPHAPPLHQDAARASAVLGRVCRPAANPSDGSTAIAALCALHPIPIRSACLPREVVQRFLNFPA
jgi:hypothetical protein